ncbi:hypothetical protein NN561_019390 [Cricetulus griseus]
MWVCPNPQEVERLEAEPDVSRLPAFFSYAHFYVIYVRFWELDGDHDLVIDRDDLGRHGDRAISSRVIDRIFSGAVTRGGSEHAHRKLTYEDFVWFLISEEDKTTPTSIEYWFRVMDLDGDGALSMFELEFFYAEQAQRLEARGVEPPPFRDLACQMLDMVNPRVPGQISLPDLRRCGLAAIFFDAFINADKFLAREQRELGAGPARDADPAGTALSDWDRFVEEEYDFLVAEEGNALQMHNSYLTLRKSSSTFMRSTGCRGFPGGIAGVWGDGGRDRRWGQQDRRMSGQSGDGLADNAART